MGHGKRDADYPSETAARRPALTTRIQCDPPNERETEEEARSRRQYELERDAREPHIRGSREDDPCASFNRALRSGLGSGGE